MAQELLEETIVFWTKIKIDGRSKLPASIIRAIGITIDYLEELHTIKVEEVSNGLPGMDQG